MRQLSLLILLFLTRLTYVFAQDLSITDIQFDTIQKQYQLFNATITIRNEGNMDVNQYILTNFYLSKDTILDKEDAYFCFTYSNKYPSGQSTVLNTSGTASQFGINAAAGTYYLIAMADWRQVLAETNEQNNVYWKEITFLPAQVDLVFNNLSVSSTTIPVGSVINATYSIRNLLPDPISSVYTTFYLSKDRIIDSTDFKWIYKYNGMRWKSSESFTQSLTVPYSIPTGEYHLLGLIENYGQELIISEKNTTNNDAYFSTIRVVGSQVDLKLNSLSLSVYDHKHANLNYSITNLGSTGIQGYSLNVYFSKDQIWDASDKPVIQNPFHDHPAYLIKGQETKEVQDYFDPFQSSEYLPAGKWYAIGVINEDKKVPETDYSNNTFVSAQIIVPDYTVALTIDSVYVEKPVEAGAKQIKVGATMRAENYNESTQLEFTLYSKDRRVIRRWYDSMFSYEEKWEYADFVELPAGLAPSDYSLYLSLKSSSTELNSVATCDFTVAPVRIAVQPTVEDAEKIVISFRPERYVTEAAYQVQIRDKNGSTVIDSTTVSDRLILPITAFLPDADYTVHVSYVKEQVQLGIGSAEMHVENYKGLLVVEKAEQSQSVGELDDYLPVQIQLLVKNTDKLYLIYYDMLDSLGQVVATQTDSVFVKVIENGRVAVDTLYGSAGSEITYTRKFPLAVWPQPGKYAIRMRSDYMQPVLIPIEVKRSSISLEEVVYNPKTTSLKWTLLNANDAVDYSVHLLSAVSDTLILMGPVSELEIANSYFKAGIPYSWSVTGTVNGKQTTSVVSAIKPFVVLSRNEEWSPFILYPNPSKGSVYLKNDFGHPSSVQIWNAGGKRMAYIQLHAKSSQPQLIAENLSSGLYIFLVENQYRKQSFKVIVQ